MLRTMPLSVSFSKIRLNLPTNLTRMFVILVSIIIGLFVAMLFVNVYFRVKVMKSYKVLVQNRVDFTTKHLLNPKKMKEEVIPLHPKFKNEIETFSNHIRYSIQVASWLIVLITLFGAVLMYYK